MSIQAKPRHSVGVAMKRKEDPRFIQGKGQLRRRPLVSGHALPLARAQHLPARRDQEHRHQRGDEGAGRQSRDHRQGSRGRRARLAADLPRLRQADGARDRQGALPVPGSRRRVRRDARGRRRRRRGGAGRLCAAAGRGRSVHRRRPTRCCCGPTARARRTTSSTGKSATRTAPLARWRPARSASSSASGSSAVIRRRSSRAAASRTSTRWDGCSST